MSHDTCWVVAHEGLAGHCCGYVIWRGPHAIRHVRSPKSIGLSRRVGGLDTRPRVGHGWGTAAVSGRHALDPQTTGAALRIPISRANDSQYRSTTRDRRHSFWGWLGAIRVLSGAGHSEPTLWLSEHDNFLSGNGRRHAAGRRPEAIKNSVKHNNVPRHRHPSHCIKRGPVRAASRYPTGRRRVFFDG